MRLVKKGTKQSQKFIGTCSVCGSQYEAERRELRIEPGSQREPGEFAHAKCTVCSDRGQAGYLIMYPCSGEQA
jgi:hypothetical protein